MSDRTIEKTCGKCELPKQANEFWKQRTTYDGLQTQCIDCKKRYYRRWIKTKAGKKSHNEAQKKYAQTPKGRQSIARVRAKKKARRK